MLGTESGVGKLLKDKFLDIILWHCLNHRLELVVGNALESISGTNDFQSFLEHFYWLYSQSLKSKRELDQCSHDLQTTLKIIGKVFTIRWVASSFRAVSAVWHSFPAMAQHFHKASNDETRQTTEKARFQRILSKFCTINFVKNLTLMADVLNELTNLSETLQSRNTTLPKAHTLLMRIQTNKKPCYFPGGTFYLGSRSRKSNDIPTSRAERRKKPSNKSGSVYSGCSWRYGRKALQDGIKPSTP